MTFTLGVATPNLALVAGDTRLYACTYEPQGQPRLERILSDAGRKLRRIRGGWAITNLLPQWEERLNLDSCHAGDFAAIRTELLTLGDRMLREVARRSPEQAALFRRERCAWVIGGDDVDGCFLRAVGYDGRDLRVPDVAQLPPELSEPEARALLTEAYRTVVIDHAGQILPAIRAIARLWGAVTERCGPGGSVGGLLELGVLHRNGGLHSRHLPPTPWWQLVEASDAAVERLLIDPDAHPDTTTYKKVLGVSSGQVQTASVANAAITAIKISVAQLSAIAADLGSITAGQLLLDLAASFIRFADAALAHGVTDILPTTVYGSFAQLSAAHTGGLTIYGISGAASISGLIVDAISQASPTAPSVALYATKKSGTGRVALAAADPAFEILTGPPGAATLLLHLRGDGQQQHADGSGSLPAMSFISDTDTGAYRAGANDWRLAAGGADVVAIATALATVFKPMDVQGALRALAGGASSANVFRVPVVLFKAQALSHTNVTESSVTSFSLPASTLDTDGYALRITITGEVTGSNSGFPRLKFGATNLDANAAILNAHKFVLTAKIVRTGAATQRAMLEWNDNGTITLLKTTPAETLSGAVTIDVRSSENTGGTTVFDSVIMELVAA